METSHLLSAQSFVYSRTGVKVDNAEWVNYYITPEMEKSDPKPYLHPPVPRFGSPIHRGSGAGITSVSDGMCLSFVVIRCPDAFARCIRITEQRNKALVCYFPSEFNL
jgi:hypothetical protein